MRQRCFLVISLVLILALPCLGMSAPQKPVTVAELALYKGTDRQQILEEGAKKEGRLTFYTTGILKQTVRPLVDAFEKKYPFIKVEIWRAETNQLITRIFEEYKVSKYLADVIELTQNGEIVMEEGGFLQPYYSPNLEYLEDRTIKKGPGGGAFSAAHYQSGIGLGYNTKLINRDQLPKTYQDLLDPKWKGKLTIVGSNTGITWMGGILDTYGEEFVGKLADQKFSVHAVSARALLDMAINGEYNFSPTIFDSHVAKSKGEGAPVDWIPLEPVSIFLGQIMLPKHSPHPHAALLFIDFDLSKQGGELYKMNGYVSPRKDVPGEKIYKKHYGPRSTKQVEHWNNVFDKLFIEK